MDIRGYEGLDTLIRADFQGPVQIVRQTIPNPETGISRICPYHNYEGLSIAPQKAGDRKGYTISLLVYTNPMSGIFGYSDIRKQRFGIKRYEGFLYFRQGTLLEYNRNQKL